MGITRDVMALQAKGISLRTIRATVDARWSKAGPSTPTPYPD